MKSQVLLPVILITETRFTSRSYSRRIPVRIFKLVKFSVLTFHVFKNNSFWKKLRGLFFSLRDRSNLKFILFWEAKVHCLKNAVGLVLLKWCKRLNIFKGLNACIICWMFFMCWMFFNFFHMLNIYHTLNAFYRLNGLYMLNVS